MVRGDDHGLVLPPKIAPWKVIIIPIGDVDGPLEEVKNLLNENNITYKVDNRSKTPGFKFAEAEVKGYPIRLELGKRDLEQGKVTLVRRDTLEKKVILYKDIILEINNLLIDIQNNMYNKALKRRNEMIYEAKTYDELLDISNNKAGFIKINWCGKEECELKIKNDTNMKSRCLIDNEEVDGSCVVCGNKALTKIYIGKQY